MIEISGACREKKAVSNFIHNFHKQTWDIT